MEECVKVFIGVGSNLGDRNKNIASALRFLEENKEIDIVKVSRLIESEPQGGPPQNKFLNGAIKINTTLSAGDLLSYLQSVEARLGRKRLIKNGPRTIDLDILLYGDTIINHSNLKVPHPRMAERDFVMIPLREIEPKISKLLNDCCKNYSKVKANSQ
ncbi:MAG: 2-amino-4-hydroxy-6-hydroxymethyldihydropteridine diphosphokinase [Candidatus Omnitrophica bacterium]|nr:2-amino-4-hydroxy-6-hydroxymethyldihydropteridine diphosphokinase [Candidatus Omnitrophota bacterium]